MPVGAGVIISANPNIYTTSVEIDTISPDPASCGDSLTFDVEVTNLDVSGPDPVGNFSIIDRITGNVLATGTLGLRGAGTAICPSATGYLQLYARYDGYSQSQDPDGYYFSPSDSNITEFALSLVPSTTSIVSPSSGDYYCYAAETTVVAQVTDGRVPVTGGNVNFRLYTDSTNYIQLPSAEVDIFGYATTTIPADTTTYGRVNYLYASFDGYGCYARSQTTKGTGGVDIYPTNNDPTSLALSVDGGTTFIATDPVTFVGTVTATNLVDPSDGYVNFYAVDIRGPTTITLGADIPTNGVASITVPGNTFDPAGTWDLYGQYFTDGYCYATSLEVNIRINPT